MRVLQRKEITGVIEKILLILMQILKGGRRKSHDPGQDQKRKDILATEDLGQDLAEEVEVVDMVDAPVPEKESDGDLGVMKEEDTVEEVGAEIEGIGVEKGLKGTEEKGPERTEDGGSVSVNEKEKIVKEKSRKEKERGRKKWQESCGKKKKKLKEKEGMMSVGLKEKGEKENMTVLILMMVKQIHLQEKSQKRKEMIVKAMETLREEAKKIRRKQEKMRRLRKSLIVMMNELRRRRKKGKNLRARVMKVKKKKSKRKGPEKMTVTVKKMLNTIERKERKKIVRERLKKRRKEL